VSGIASKVHAESSSFLGSGYDQVSIPACTSRRILVSNTPDVVNEATADATIFLMLGALRNFNRGISTLRDRRWRGQPPIGFGHDPQGKTLGILGMGGIGRNVKAKAEAFGMKVQYSNRNKLPDNLSGGAKFVSFEELLATSDVISTNLPMNVSTCFAVLDSFPPWSIKVSCRQHANVHSSIQGQTRHILNKAAFQRMKDGVVIVNTARGGVIDEAELVNALDSGKVRSCGLDVFEDEPTIHEGLLWNPNVFLTPHMAAWTHETLLKMEALAIENVRAAVETGRLKTVVKEQRDLHL
jgi:glyoxylate reductase